MANSNPIRPNSTVSAKPTVNQTNLSPDKTDSANKNTAAKNVKNPSELKPKSERQPESDQWVSLHTAPSDYSHDEALLLCELDPGEWVSWVPGYGEFHLNLNQFTC